MKKIKIAFDVHGVITSDPDRYRSLMKSLADSGFFEVWVISGPRVKPVAEELHSYGIERHTHYHGIDTIVEYLLRLGSKHTIKYVEDTEHYYFNIFEWNTAKADICDEYGIHILIDDTKAYEQYFDDCETTFILKD